MDNRVPILLDAAAPGCDSYSWTLPPVVPGVVASWSYQGSMRSFRWRDGGVAKTRNAFDSHKTPGKLYELLAEAAEHGVFRPSSYASLLHDRYYPTKATAPARRAMSWAVPGGWEALLLPRGDYAGTWYKYDLRSAYLWALHAGLPDHRTYRYTETIDHTRAGCYLMYCQPNATAPYPYDRGGKWPILAEEIERYGIRGRVMYGITWDNMLSPAPLLDIIHSYSCWKEVGRSYWGRWAATAPLECHSYDAAGIRARSWQMPATHANPIWAHVILSRVRARLHDATLGARVARVYVDNVVIDKPLPTGDGIGSWRFEAQYDGLRVVNLHRILSLGDVNYVRRQAA